MKNRNRGTVVIGVTFHTSLGFHKDLALQMQARGYEIHLVSSGGVVLRELSHVFHTHQLEMARQPSLVRDFLALIKWVKLLRKIKPDVVLAGTPKASLLGMMASKLLGVGIRIYWVHGLRLETAKGIARKILHATERVTAAASTQMYAVSPSLKEQLLSMGIARPEKVTVLGGGSTQGVDLKAFFPPSSASERSAIKRSLGLNPDLYTIGFAGRLAKEKGVEELREAVVNLHQKGGIFQVLILGSVEDASGEALIEGLAAAGVPFSAKGHVRNVEDYFRAMDLFCLPTYREGLGNVILEAFATKLPVISTSVTGVTDLVRNEETGLLIPPQDTVSLELAIDRVMRDPDSARVFGENAFRFVTKNFDSQEVVAAQVRYIEKSLGRQ